MFNKLAYSVEMSFDVPDSEKELAEHASQLFMSVINVLSLAKDHLDIMYNPFKKHDNISPEALHKRRGKLNIFKQQIKDNFEKVKYVAFHAISKLNYFASDTHTVELLNAFKDSIGNVEKQVIDLLEVIDNLKDPEFKEKILSGIENVKTESDELEKLIRDRIIKHIDTNILAKDWVSNTGSKLHTKIEDKIPLITELFNQRQKALESTQNGMASIEKRPQLLNPGNEQRVYYPTDAREASEPSKVGEL